MKKLARRDRCYLTGARAGKLSRQKAALAWHSLALSLEDMAEQDIPKFADLLRAIRHATITAKTACE